MLAPSHPKERKKKKEAGFQKFQLKKNKKRLMRHLIKSAKQLTT